MLGWDLECAALAQLREESQMKTSWGAALRKSPRASSEGSLFRAAIKTKTTNQETGRCISADSSRSSRKKHIHLHPSDISVNTPHDFASTQFINRIKISPGVDEKDLGEFSRASHHEKNNHIRFPRNGTVGSGNAQLFFRTHENAAPTAVFQDENAAPAPPGGDLKRLKVPDVGTEIPTS